MKTKQTINWLIPYQSFLLPTDAQVNYFKRVLKFTLNQLQHVLVFCGVPSEVCHPHCAFKLYSEVNSVKKHNYKIWLNDGIY